MKKKWITIGIGLLILVILIVSYFAVKQYAKDESEEEESKTEEIVSIEADTITAVSFLIDKKEYTFEKGEEGWTNTEDKNFPVNTEKMGEIIDAVSSISTTRTLKDVDNLKEYGLDEPENKVTVETSDGKTVVLEFGSLNEVTKEYYMTLNQKENTIYLVEESTVSPFTGDLYDYASGTSYPTISSDSMTAVTVQKEDSSYMVKEDDSMTSGWAVGDENGGNLQTADSGNISTLLAAVSGLAYQDFMNYNCSDMSQYGLDAPAATITIQYEEEVTEADDTGSETEEDNTEEGEEKTSEEVSYETKQAILKIGSQDEEGNYYVNLNNSQEVYTMTESSLSDILSKRPSDLYDLTVAYAAESQLAEINVTEDDMVYQIVLKEKENEDSEDADSAETEYEYYLNDKKLDSDLSDTFYNSLANLTAAKILEEPYQSAAGPELTISYQYKDDTSSTVQFYAYDENLYAGVSDNGKTYLINKMSFKNLKQVFEDLVKQ